MRGIAYVGVVVVLGATALTLGYMSNSLPSQLQQPISQFATKLPVSVPQVDTSNFSSQATVLKDRGSVVVEEGSKVLGAAISVDDSQPDSSLTDRALEYGRYLYCQQVVTDWEKDHPSDN